MAADAQFVRAEIYVVEEELVVDVLALSGWLWAATSTTVLYVHRGVALPAARVIVIAVPTVFLLGFWWLMTRQRRKDK